MGSQTVEILRQGVWASLTGGWFYDPHQNVFCNIVHLYLWLFLICSPFVTYLYFAKTFTSWTVYCLSTASTIIAVKLINIMLHVMYDQAQIISDSGAKSAAKPHEPTNEADEVGIEMQVIASSSSRNPIASTSNNDHSTASRSSTRNRSNTTARSSSHKRSSNISQANSSISIEYPERSTIDLKVDVHRKNSSESSDGEMEAGPSTTIRRLKPRDDDFEHVDIDAGPFDLDASGLPKPNLCYMDEGDFLSHSERLPDRFMAKVRRIRTRLRRQPSFDSSSGSGLNNYPVRRPVSSHHLHRGQLFGSQMDRNFTTKSELTIEMPSTSERFATKRKDSTSTMSAIQLSAPSSGPSGSQRNQSGMSGAPNMHMHRQLSLQPNVRRIKSSALDQSSAQPSFSNLSPHPNSVETINGRMLRNPPHAIIPPPSSLHRTYPIAEIADERYFLSTNSGEEDDDDVGDDDDGDDDDEDDDGNRHISYKFADERATLDAHEDDDKNITDDVKLRNQATTGSTGAISKHRKSRQLDADTERQRKQSSDSENDLNIGSQSPLLDRSRSTKSSANVSERGGASSKTEEPGTPADPSEEPSAAELDDDYGEGAVGGTQPQADAPQPPSSLHIVLPANAAITSKSEDSGCPSSDCDQASASSKDMLLRKAQKPSTSSAPDHHWAGFNMDANAITLDLGANGHHPPDPATPKTATTSTTSTSTPTSTPTTLDTPPAGGGGGGRVSKSLGAIPKTSYTRTASGDEVVTVHLKPPADAAAADHKSPSHTSSSNSANASSSNSLSSLNRNELHVLTQTADGFVLQNAAPNNPYLIAHRGGLPPLVPAYDRRPADAFSVARKPYTSVHVRRPGAKLTTTRRHRHQPPTHHHQPTDRDFVTITAPPDMDEPPWAHAVAGPSTGSGPAGLPLQSNSWDVVDVKLTERFHSLFFQDPPNPISRAQVTRIIGEYWNQFNHFTLPVETQPPQPKRYYKFPWKCCNRELKFSMDRLQLLALFDRDKSAFQTVWAIVIATVCSVLGAWVLQLGFYRDLLAFLFCFVMAGSQYSLVKSVQPDASSSAHGDDARYSRPIYFCLCTGILIAAYHLSAVPADVATALPPPPPPPPLVIFGFPFSGAGFFHGVKECMAVMLLVFPVLFSFGLFAQVNTFLMFTLEQLDMHVFGGNAVCSLAAAILNVVRSLLACCVLYGFAFGGLAEPRGTQHVLFSCFCALLVAVAYHLSRTASDFTYLWMIVKHSFAIHHDDDEVSAQQSARARRTDRRRGQHSSAGTSSRSLDKAAGPSPLDQSARKSAGSAHLNECATDDKAISAANTTGTGVDPLPATSHVTAMHVTAECIDPLPGKLKATVYNRLKNDCLVCTVIGGVVLSLHSSTVFTALQPELNPILHLIVIVVGFGVHYVMPQMRKHFPWLCFTQPILKQREFGMFEATKAAQIMWFERVHVMLTFVEKNVLLPLVFISALTADSMTVASKFGVAMGAGIVVVCGLKSIRNSYSDPSSQFIILVFTVLFFQKDFSASSETFLVDYFLVSIMFKKTCELLLKLQFIVTYIAPWQITWGSAFHAFAQPFSVPHSAMLFLQAAISAVLSTPLIPFLGSAIFITSYVRPIKFWERDYNTRRIDHSNTRLSSQLERDLGADDNNLNSIFYEHLTRSLQHSLCGDLMLGRWGNVSQGDCFVLASDYLNCLVHIIELGNGLCTFQMRGLEFRGTYCQQREVEAISEGLGENDGCCCCTIGHLPNMLSVNSMFTRRWLAWQVVAAQYILEGYSITDNLAQATLQVYEFRKVLITYYIKSIIYYTIQSPKLHSWLSAPGILDGLKPTMDRSFADLDPIFNHNLDEDFDFRASGITRASFCSIYLDWIQHCYSNRTGSAGTASRGTGSGGAGAGASDSERQNHTASTSVSEKTTDRSGTESGLEMEVFSSTLASHDFPMTGGPRGSSRSISSPRMSPRAANDEPKPNDSKSSNEEINPQSPIVSLLLALSLLARRTLATATHTHSSLTGVEFFLHGLHALFKGDYRITSIRDEWIFSDMDLLHSVIAPAVKMSLKLHQDHFLSPEEYDDPAALYQAITAHTSELVISHEADPLWRNAVLRGAPQLLALRHVMEDGTDEYRLIRLTKSFLSFRVIKLNRECVRGLWAGQQQELIYLRNRNPERGSIQNAKQALRNIINSSCDQPIGYPIYVSPLTTSYAETSKQYRRIVGGDITLDKMQRKFWQFCRHVRQRFSEGCSSGSATLDQETGGCAGAGAGGPVVVVGGVNPAAGGVGPGPMDLSVHFNAQAAAQGGAALTYGSQTLAAAPRCVGAGSAGPIATGSVQSIGKPTSSTLLAGFLLRERDLEPMAGDRASAGVYRKRGSVMSSKGGQQDQRRATFPSGSSPEAATAMVKELGSASGSLSGGKAANEDATSTPMAGPTKAAAKAGSPRCVQRRPNSSQSSGNLSARQTTARHTPNIAERKSKSEERQSSHDNDAFDTDGRDAFGTAVSLPATTHTSATLLDTAPKYSSIPLPQPADMDST